MNLYAADTEYPIIISSKDQQLPGLLYIPKGAHGLVVFVHGSGSNLHSSRNNYVAKILQEANLATLLFDLLTPEEEAIDAVTAELRFNIPFLADRLVDATYWCINNLSAYHLNISYFGASTGAAAALMVAAKEKEVVKAVVSRGGRPDLAGNLLPQVKAPTLLIVGGEDEIVIGMNKAARREMTCLNELEIIPRATHLFEEPGALHQVAQLAKSWFLRYCSTL